MVAWLDTAAYITAVYIGVIMLILLQHLLNNKYQPRRKVMLVFLVNDYCENDQTKRAIQYLGNTLLTIDMINDPDECEQFLKKQNDDSRIILVTSDAFSARIIPRIHCLSSIAIIYLYCNDSKHNSPLIEKYSKVKGMITDFNQLIQDLSTNSNNVEIRKNESFENIFEKTTTFITKYCQLHSSDENAEVQGSM